MAKYADAQSNPAICDRCGFRGLRRDMVFGYQTVHYDYQPEPTEVFLVVHRWCRDKVVKRKPIRNDPEAIMNPRPDRVEPFDGPNGFEPAQTGHATGGETTGDGSTTT